MEKAVKKIQIVKPVALKVLNTQITTSNGHLIIHGYVVNKSDITMEYLVALAMQFTDTNVLIKTADMMVDDTHLKPTFMSVFDIATPDDPRVDHVEVTFKLLFGPEIDAEGPKRLNIYRKPIPGPFIDYEIRKNVATEKKKN